MFFGKEIRVKLKGQAQEAYLELQKREDKEAQTMFRSINRIIDIAEDINNYTVSMPSAISQRHTIQYT